MSIRNFTAAVAALGLIAALPSSALAAKTAHHRSAKTGGVVTAVGSSSLTITNKAGVTTTITVNADTRLRAPDRDASSSVTLADIIAGDKVKIQLSKSDPTVARSVKVKVEALMIAGTVAAVGKDSVTITLDDATQKTLTVNADTKLKIPDTDASGSVTLADLKVGDKIKVETSATDATLAVSINAKGTHKRGSKTVGIVNAVGSSSLTITDKAGVTKTITVNSATKLRAPDRDASGSVTLADLKVGDAIRATAIAAAGSTLLALRISAGQYATGNGAADGPSHDGPRGDRGGRGERGR